ncbi:MAG: MFS transporter [Candidatus Heimdallarchaeota archaeon]|nr:MFS transporter [Candidatus Heimdallarchaeota archaeon]
MVKKEDIKEIEGKDKPSLLDILRNRSYMLVFGGQITNIIASILAGMTFSYLVYSITENAALMGLMSLVGSFPTILIILFTGVIVDRIDQRKLIFISIFLRFIVFSGFLLLYLLKDYLIIHTITNLSTSTGGIQIIYSLNYIHFIWPMYVLLFISNAGFSFYNVAIGAYSKFIVEKKNYLVANSFTQTITQIASVIGPILAGLIIDVSYLYSFIISLGIMSFAAIFSLLLVYLGKQPPEIEKEPTESFTQEMKKVFEDIKVGFDTIKSIPKVNFVTWTYVAFNFITCTVNGFYTVVLQGEMELNASWLGAIQAVMAAVAVVSSLVVMKLGKVNRKIILVIIILALETIGLAIFTFNRNVWIAILLNTIPFGIVNGTANIPSNTLRQEKIPHEKLGRAFSTILLFISIANLTGMGIITSIANYVNPMYVLLVGTILCLILTIVCMVLFLKKENLRCSDYEDEEIEKAFEKIEGELISTKIQKDEISKKPITSTTESLAK